MPRCQKYWSFDVGRQLDGCSNGGDSETETSIDDIHSRFLNPPPPSSAPGSSDSPTKTMKSPDKTLDSTQVTAGDAESPESEGRGRGKRKRKLCLRYDEPDDSDDCDLYESLHKARKCRKTCDGVKKNRERRINGGVQKNKVDAPSVGPDSFPVRGDRRNCAVPASATKSNGGNASLCLSNGGQTTVLPHLSFQSSVGNGGTTASPRGVAGMSAAPKEDDGGASNASEDKLPLRTGRDEELELEVTNENGEVEIVTIVDLHSSSDEDDLMAMNGEDEFVPFSDYDTDHDHQPGETEFSAPVFPAESPCSAAIGPMKTLCPSSLLGDQSCRVDCDLKQNGINRLSAGASASNSRKESSMENKKSISARKKKRKRARGHGDGVNRFDLDVKDGDKVRRLKKIYGLQRQNRAKTNQVQSNCDRTASASSSLGPYVHVVGPRDAPTTCKVVNVRDVDLDAPSKSTKNQLLLEAFCVPSSVKLLDSVPWLCVFCGNGSTHSNLGDLFGPYHPRPAKTESAAGEFPPVKDGGNAAGENRVAQSPRKHSARLSAGSSDSSLEGFASETPVPQELWVHESCAVWTGGIYVAGGKLQGLEEAASVASHVVCFGCHKVGATLGCYMKGCSQNYHFLCAVKSGCFFQEENFSILCPRHRDRGKKVK